MASGAQQNTNGDFVSHAQQAQVQQPQQQQQQQQHHIDGSTAHLSSNSVGVSPDYTSDNHLAGLVQAATAAAGQDVGWAQNDESDMMAAGHGRAIQNHLDSYSVGMHLDENGFATTSQSGHPFGNIPGGEPAVSGDRQIAAPPVTAATAVRKRKRTQPNVDPAMTSATARFRFGDVDEASLAQDGAAVQVPQPDESSLDIREMPPQRVISDARAAGVHSAVALFRQPSASSKKATRPPMSKMFASLGLSPENFLHLQAAAKQYMLDENHLERRDCVGQRGRGDTEMVKLRLWNCVRDFLNREGNGLRYFGENVEGADAGPNKMIWPRDEQRIISLVTPLLRRMITNERQRKYVSGARKGGNSEDKSKRNSASVDNSIPESVQRYHQPPPNGTTELGMLDLIRNEYPTYQTDWDSVARSYETYNQDYRLDNLGSISGLPQQDWWGLVAAVDCHYQIDHGGDATLCTDSCQECTVNHLMSSESMSEVDFQISGKEDIARRNYFATVITRDVTRIVKNYLLEHPNIQPASTEADHAQFQTSEAISQDPIQIQPGLGQPQPQHQPASEILPVTLSINIIQNQEHKRMLPRFQVPASQCTDFATLLDTIRQYYHGQHSSQTPQNMRVRAWLDDGLQPILNDTQWLAALLTASEIEWMDNELKVIVDRVDDTVS
ncbi:hypothetical protein MGYG_05022 [Nannizzia gypsea CBS 118893]|uniref:Uncharacterized protein n=1 Tax=Arthroderma gypseum (strain ATCC MYA-4604 / CBS 118893) TaxID=535722 RepID=E4UY27_ARTGP|nr:hypothetical protein MGYG_05022 [Nannizzia gypsea CBS 118893]EFR02020.1 hypothetical protein MGYG_05022 [Nannizzia gypsea CBS 118893]